MAEPNFGSGLISSDLSRAEPNLPTNQIPIFDTDLLDTKLTMFVGNSIIRNGKNLCTINSDMRFTLCNYFYNIFETNVTRDPIRMTDKLMTCNKSTYILNDVEKKYIIDIFKPLANQVYYKVYQKNGFSLYHESEVPELIQDIKDGRIHYIREYNCNGLMRSRCYFVMLTEFTPAILDIKIDFNKNGKEIELRTVLNTIDYDLLKIRANSFVVFELLRGQIFYKTNEQLYHSSELPEVQHMISDIPRSDIAKFITSSRNICGFVITVLLDSFSRYILKSIYKKRASVLNLC